MLAVTGRHTLQLRQLSPGAAPAWSPNGAWIALTRNGRVELVCVRDGSARRLVRGSAPAWSPDGSRIAYVGAGHFLNVVAAAAGGRAQRVTTLRVRSVAWRPRPLRGACAPAKGTTIVASSAQAVITRSSASTSWYGCLPAVGRTRLLDPVGGPYEGARLVSVALVGRFAVLQFNSGYKAESCASSASVYDLGTRTSIPPLISIANRRRRRTQICSPSTQWGSLRGARHNSAPARPPACAWPRRSTRATITARAWSTQRTAAIQQSIDQRPAEPQPVRQPADLDPQRHPATDHPPMNARRFYYPDSRTRAEPVTGPPYGVAHVPHGISISGGLDRFVKRAIGGGIEWIQKARRRAHARLSRS